MENEHRVTKHHPVVFILFSFCFLYVRENKFKMNDYCLFSTLLYFEMKERHDSQHFTNIHERYFILSNQDYIIVFFSNQID
jgi:hypothetical protein